MTGEELEELQALARADLIPFCVLTDDKYDLAWHLEEIAEELEDLERKVASGEIRRTIVILELPPRHGKSELASIRFPAWVLGKHPDKHVVTASYSSDLSQAFGTKTRGLVQSPAYQAIFPNLKLSADTSAKSRWLTNVGGSYTSVGVGSSITGFGAHFLVIDDPHKDRAEADSKTYRNKIWEWFRSTAWSRLEPEGVCIIIMQRWHKDDLVGRILSEPEMFKGVDIKRIKFPAIATENEKHRKAGEALWPMRYNLESLESIRSIAGAMNWSSQYLQEPIAAENQEFKPEYFKYFEEGDLAGKKLVYTTTVDLAVGDKEAKRGDYVAIITVAKESGNPNWYIVDCLIEKIDPLAACDYLFMLYKKYRMSTVAIETNAYQKTFKFWLQEEMKKREVYMPLAEIKSSTQKEAKIRGLIGYYQTGVIFHRKGYLLLESQLMNFPQDQHDDGPDALAMQLEVIQSDTADTAVSAMQSHLVGEAHESKLEVHDGSIHIPDNYFDRNSGITP